MKNKMIYLLFALLVITPHIIQAQEMLYDTIRVVLNTNRKMQKSPDYGSVADNRPPIGQYTAGIRYIMDKNGHVSDIIADSRCGYGMEEEVVRSAKKMPRWIPAEQHPVNNIKTYHRKLVTFIVSHPDFDMRCNGQYVLTSGLPNVVTVTTTRWKLSRLRLKIDGKKIRPNHEGQFIITPLAKPGERVKVSLYHAGKKRGEASFEVKAAG
jgi:hypothetical protein